MEQAKLHYSYCSGRSHCQSQQHLYTAGTPKQECVTPHVYGLLWSSTHTSAAHLCIIRGVFILESLVRYTAFVRYSQFGGYPLFKSRKCIASTGIAVATSSYLLYGGGPLLGGSVIRGSTVFHANQDHIVELLVGLSATNSIRYQ